MRKRWTARTRLNLAQNGTEAFKQEQHWRSVRMQLNQLLIRHLHGCYGLKRDWLEERVETRDTLGQSREGLQLKRNPNDPKRKPKPSEGEEVSGRDHRPH
ncbi:unnamed protein product [Boreogadus saida]